MRGGNHLKKQICLFLILCLLCTSLCGCFQQSNTITVISGSQLQYQDKIYNKFDDYFDYGYITEDDSWADDDAWVYIGTKFSTSENVTGIGLDTYSGTTEDNPAIIQTPQGVSWAYYVREDIQLEQCPLKPYNKEPAFSLSLQQILTGKLVPWSIELEEAITSNYELIVQFEEYPMMRVKMVFCITEDAVYLSPRWNIDYWEVTDEFVAILEQMEDLQ